MTPERKAELHRLAEACLDGRDSGTRIANAIPALLDELEACQKNADWQRRNVNGVVSQVELERDSLAAKVVVLRAAIQHVVDDEANAQGWGPDVTSLDTLKDALADTEAAATTWLEADRREQRLAGARELYDRGATVDDCERLLREIEAMEREAGHAS